MPTAESELINAIKLEATNLGARLFRVNTGTGWSGTVIHKEADRAGSMVTIRNARPLHAGLGKGGSDLIGWSREGRFVAIEAKAGKTRITNEQRRFLEAVRAAGGLAGVARTVQDARDILAGGQPL